MLQSVPSIRRITIANNPITDRNFEIFNSVPYLEGIDDVNRSGVALRPMQHFPATILPENPTPRSSIEFQDTVGKYSRIFGHDV